MCRCDTEGHSLELDLVALSLWLNLMNEGVFSNLNDSLSLSFSQQSYGFRFVFGKTTRAAPAEEVVEEQGKES